MKLAFIILQDLIATLDQIMDALPADALFSSDLTERHIIIYCILIHSLLMFGEKLTVEVIQQILFQNPVHLIQCLSIGHAICTLAIIL